MTYYHRSKDAALTAGEPYASHFHLKAELEASNGYVLVLIPKSREVFDYPLGPLLEFAEVDLTSWYRLKKRPAGYKPPPAVSRARGAAPAPRSKPTAPPPPPPPPPPRAV